MIEEGMLPSLTLEATGRPLRTKLLHGVSSTALKSYHLLLMKFISLIGALSTPGQWPAGPMQAWALRRMGVKCSSRQVWIGPRISIDNPSCLELGARVVIGPDSRLTAYTRIEIGDDFLSAPGLYINTGAHDVRTLAPTFAPVVIGAKVRCGTRVTICSGVKIGNGATIGAGALVLHNIPAYHLAVGVPCKPLKEIPQTERRWSNFRREPPARRTDSPS